MFDGLRAANGGIAAPERSGRHGAKRSRLRSSAVVTRCAEDVALDSCASDTASVGNHDVQGAAPAGVQLRRALADRTYWRKRYQTSLVGLDFLAVVLAALVGYVARFGVTIVGATPDLAYALVLPPVWVALVALNGAYEGRFVGVGSAEFERIFRVFLHVTVLTAFVAFATKVDFARGFILVVLPLALALNLGARYVARKRLHSRRVAGESLTSVLAVGGAAAVAEFTEQLRRDQYAGMRVVGACLPQELPSTDDDLAALGVPVLGGVDSITDAVARSGAHTVAVLSGEIRPDRLRWISWQLEGSDTDLVVDPGLVEVGGRRLHVQPVAGLPLLHVDEPEFRGVRRVAKSAFDRIAAGSALVLLAPLLLALAAAVRLTSRGPAFFLQERVGMGGKTFKVFKFRSMCVDAEARLGELQGRNENDGVLFKMKNDPRITRVGRVLRKYSLDELPQLLNVVKGEMSLVGPRPPLPSEVAQYETDVRRRLLVKPGITGLWQVSGRSDLSWDESVRLDLRYVENWSFTTDLMILWKTVFTVTTGSGAY